MKVSEQGHSRFLIVTPTGRDATLAAEALNNAKIATEVCDDLGQLSDQIDEDVAGVLLAEEALSAAELPRFIKCLQDQPAWSDLPLLILLSAFRPDDVASVEILNLFGPSGNVTLLERPLRSIVLVSTVQVALRARRRQWEVRDLIAERETILASISDAFSAIDRDWRYTFVNTKVAELAGMPRSELVGRVIWEIFPEAVGSEFYERAHRAMETRQSDHFEIFYKPWNRWLETRIYPSRNGIVVFRADITERKQHEERLRENEVKLRELEARVRLAVEAGDIGTFDFDPSTGELQFSDRSREMFGIPTHLEVTYETYLAGIHPEDRHIVYETVNRVRQAQSSGRFEIEYRTIGVADREERWVAERGRAIRDSAGKVTRFIGTMVEVTEKKNAEIMLQRAKEEAEEANRAKDRFLAMLSHELRTPLTPVLMTIASLRRDPDLGESLRADLEVLHRNVELEALLIDDLLDLTRIAHGKLELHSDAVDVHATLEHALSICAGDLLGKKIEVVRRYEAQEHHCWADPARLQQVFWNLVKNAAKFTPHHGRIEISTYNNENHQITVEIADNGIGIDPRVLPQIFDAFVQGTDAASGRYGGLGLGLAISKRVIDLHQGTIAASSEGKGQGATFTVTLNAMETSLLEGPVLFLESEAPPLRHIQILLVEDHEDTARVLGRILRNAGFEVSHAATMADARALAASKRFDLVISDLGLPDGSGLDLMKSLRDAQGMKGIALSGFGTDDDVNASAEAGFAAHLTKPVDWDRLRAEIERLMPAKDPGARSAA
jgi:PAS domain S-box-containing protein